MKSKFIKMLIVLMILTSSALVVWAGLHFSGGAGFGSGSIRIHAELVGVSGGRTATVTTTITNGYNLTAICRKEFDKPLVEFVESWTVCHSAAIPLRCVSMRRATEISARLTPGIVAIFSSTTAARCALSRAITMAMICGAPIR